MEIIDMRIFNVDIQKDSVSVTDKNLYGSDLDEYIVGLIGKFAKKTDGRLFGIERETTEIISLIPRIISRTNFDEVTDIAAKRLLSIEKDAQSRIDKLGKKIQKGIMVQAFVKNEDIHHYIICKADHNDFLREDNFKKAKGLPIKNKVFKAFSANINADNSIGEIVVYDTSSPMSKYWWKDYLELVETYTDKHNTNTAFEAIDKTVFTKMKREHPQDYVILRNSTIKYFKSEPAFKMEEYLDKAFGDYQPHSSTLNIDQIKSKIRELPEKNNFDEAFNILKDEIKAKFINKIPLTKQIELHLKEDVPNIENVITAEEDTDGTKYVKIKSEEGYKYFHERKTLKKG